MVSTRRSRSSAGTEQGADGPGRQTAVVSQLKGSKQSADAPGLQPIAEEREQPSAVVAKAVSQPLQTVETSQHAAEAEHQQTRRQWQEQQQPPPHRQTIGEPVDAADSDSSDADDWDFDGQDMLHSLAATIQSALGGRSGGRQQQQLQQQSRQLGSSGSGEIDPEQLRWTPHTGLQVPAKAGQAVVALAASTTANGRRTRQQQQQQQQGIRVGPVVQNPAAVAAADVDDSSAAVAAAAVEGNALVSTKPKGLAKHSHAPTLDPVAAAKEARKLAPKTAGKKWYDLPAVKITDDVKRDLRLLRLRGAYDPKRFYKSFDETKFPKHFAIGTVLDDPLDYYGGRLTAGQRRSTLTEQLLADTDLKASREKRFNQLQEEAQKWTKHKKRKTSMPRKAPSRHRPKY